MNKKLKEKWLKALRSGKYHILRGSLKRLYKNGPKHCCLGVLLEIDPDVIRNPKGPGWVSKKTGKRCDSNHTLSSSYCESIGTFKHIMQDLASINDKTGKYPIKEMERWLLNPRWNGCGN